MTPTPIPTFEETWCLVSGFAGVLEAGGWVVDVDDDDEAGINEADVDVAPTVAASLNVADAFLQQV